MTKFLGTILDSFTMHNTHRVIIVDADCFSQLKSGDFIEVVYFDGRSVRTQVLDGILDEGAKFNSKNERVSAIRVNNDGFEDGNISDCKVYLA